MSDETTKSVKAPRKKPAPAPKSEKVKASLSLDVQVYRRLFVTSVMTGQSASSIVEGLISEGLRQWSLPSNLAGRANSRHQSVSVEIAAHGEEMAAQHPAAA